MADTDRKTLRGVAGALDVVNPQSTWSTSPTRRTPKPYPTTPPPLSRGEVTDFAARRRSATRNLDEAQARRSFESKVAQSKFDRFTAGLTREAQQRERSMRDANAGRGLALQPRAMGKDLRQLRDWETGEATAASATLADQMAALDEMVDRMRRDRDRERAYVDADRARAQTQLGRLVGSAGGR